MDTNPWGKAGPQHRQLRAPPFIQEEAILLCSKNYKFRFTVVCFILQAFEKKTEVEKIRGRNRKLVDNILPEHVADYFLQHQSKDETVTKLNLRAVLYWKHKSAKEPLTA